MITVYHASPVKLNKPTDLKNCSHVGGYLSALQAVHRKLERLQDLEGLSNEDCIGYIYQFKLDLAKHKVAKVSDVGNDESWKEEIEHYYSLGYEILSYVNKYEPDFSFPVSYLVLDTKILPKSFDKVIAMSIDEIEDKIETELAKYNVLY